MLKNGTIRALKSLATKENPELLNLSGQDKSGRNSRGSHSKNRSGAGSPSLMRASSESRVPQSNQGVYEVKESKEMQEYRESMVEQAEKLEQFKKFKE